jgi:hypothetical protein
MARTRAGVLIIKDSKSSLQLSRHKSKIQKEEVRLFQTDVISKQLKIANYFFK